jgi:hypothetical protein
MKFCFQCLQKIFALEGMSVLEKGGGGKDNRNVACHHSVF